MSSESPAEEITLLWQSQRREYPIMSAEEIQLKAVTVQAKVRRNLIVGGMLGVVLLILATIAIIKLPDLRTRLTMAAIVVLTTSLAYSICRRILPLHQMSAKAGLNGCIEFYRNELIAKHRSALLTWRFLVPIVIFSFITWGFFLRTSPVVPKVLFPSVLLALLFIRHVESRRLKRTLATLDELERGNSQLQR